MRKIFTINSEYNGYDTPNLLSIEFYQEEKVMLLSGSVRPFFIKNDIPICGRYMIYGNIFTTDVEKTELVSIGGTLYIIADDFRECELTFLINLKQQSATLFKISNYGFLCKFRYMHRSTKTLIPNQDLGKFDVFYDETTNTITVPSLGIVEKNE